MCFGLVGSHNQLCTLHTLTNLLVTNLFYIHARHWMIETARQDKNGMLQSAPWSVGRSLSDVTSVSRKSPNQPIRRSQELQSVFLNISSQAENCEASKCWGTVVDLVTNVWQSILKLCENFWWLCKVVLRIGLKIVFFVFFFFEE